MHTVPPSTTQTTTPRQHRDGNSRPFFLGRCTPHQSSMVLLDCSVYLDYTNIKDELPVRHASIPEATLWPPTDSTCVRIAQPSKHARTNFRAGNCSVALLASGCAVLESGRLHSILLRWVCSIPLFLHTDFPSNDGIYFDCAAYMIQPSRTILR